MFAQTSKTGKCAPTINAVSSSHVETVVRMERKEG